MITQHQFTGPDLFTASAQFALPGLKTDLPKTVELTIEVSRIALIPSKPSASLSRISIWLEWIKIHLQLASHEILIQQLRTNERASLMGNTTSHAKNGWKILRSAR